MQESLNRNKRTALVRLRGFIQEDAESNPNHADHVCCRCDQNSLALVTLIDPNRLM